MTMRVVPLWTAMVERVVASWAWPGRLPASRGSAPSAMVPLPMDTAQTGGRRPPAHTPHQRPGSEAPRVRSTLHTLTTVLELDSRAPRPGHGAGVVAAAADRCHQRRAQRTTKEVLVHTVGARCLEVERVRQPVGRRGGGKVLSLSSVITD